MNAESENPFQSPRDAGEPKPRFTVSHALEIFGGFAIGLVVWPVVLLIILMVLGSFW